MDDGTTDERWKACQALGKLGPVIARDVKLAKDVIDRCKNASEADSSGVVRYHAVHALGLLGVALAKKQPDIASYCGECCVNALARDTYDRVRRGAVAACYDLCPLSKARPELAIKMRAQCVKTFELDVYDIVRSDAAAIIGKIGGGSSPGTKTLLKNFEKLVEDEKSEMVSIYAELALFKCRVWSLDRDRAKFETNVKKLVPLLTSYQHWSFWRERECMAKALGDLGPLLGGPMAFLLDKVFDMLEILANDPVWDVRIVACKALGDFAPPVDNMASSKPGGDKSSDVLIPALRRRAVPVLERAVRDGNDEVRIAAREALEKRR